MIIIKEMFDSPKRTCIISAIALTAIGIIDTFTPSVIASSILDVLGDMCILVFGYFLCLKHQNNFE